MDGVIVSLQTVYQRWTTVRRLEIKERNERIFVRDVEDHGSAAVVLPYDPTRRTALIVEQARYPKLFSGVAANSLEPIAGRIDEGETAETAARREALEEAGLQLTHLEQVVVSWTMPAVSTERAYMYFSPYTEADRVGPGGGLPDEDEQIIVHEMKLSDLAGMAKRGELTDAKLHLLVLALQVAKPELFPSASDARD